MFFSNVTIIFNKWLLDTAGFSKYIMLPTNYSVYCFPEANKEL